MATLLRSLHMYDFVNASAPLSDMFLMRGINAFRTWVLGAFLKSFLLLHSVFQTLGLPCAKVRIREHSTVRTSL
jgi:hypothetical protein